MFFRKLTNKKQNKIFNDKYIFKYIYIYGRLIRRKYNIHIRLEWVSVRERGSKWILSGSYKNNKVKNNALIDDSAES